MEAYAGFLLGFLLPAIVGSFLGWLLFLRGPKRFTARDLEQAKRRAREVVRRRQRESKLNPC